MHPRSASMASHKRLLTCLMLLAAMASSSAGPLPANVTSSELELTSQESCRVGETSYAAGQEVPGATPCELCRCAGGAVRCARRHCDPRPGCKAIHRADHCCPTYQCECEEGGRVYSNGEKLVDAAEPCRVCYCQGGEVVCRRVACFLRDDCRPRLVPGRCCPQYDNCPLRGVTSLPDAEPAPATKSKVENQSSSAASAVPENVKQEITIKEITPISEIPVITRVKGDSSSRAPLVPRDVTADGPDPEDIPSETIISNENKQTDNVKTTAETPTKISFSTLDFVHGETAPSPATSSAAPESTSSAGKPTTEEEDPSFFDHNPAFPPLPDDLSVLSNRGDEIVPETSMDNDRGPNRGVSSVSPSPESYATESGPPATEAITIREVTATREPVVGAETLSKNSPMLNLRAAIPTEILNMPSSVAEEIDGEEDEGDNGDSNTTIPVETSSQVTTILEKHFKDLDATTKIQTDATVTSSSDVRTTQATSTSDMQTVEERAAESHVTAETGTRTEGSSVPIETDISTNRTTHVEDLTAAKSSFLTTEKSESTIFTERLATVDPIEVIERKESVSLSPPASASLSPPASASLSPPASASLSPPASASLSPPASASLSPPASASLSPPASASLSPPASASLSPPASASLSPPASASLSPPASASLSPPASSEFTTEDDRISKATAAPDAARKNNVLADLIDLVGDVASISDHTDRPETTPSGPAIPDSEELIPVNVGYKSKNNWNPNSITEAPTKDKARVEIEDEDEVGITDVPAPHDTVEPTTRRPIIDNVTAGDVSNVTAVRSEIEIITQSYVPTINRRPTKVVMRDESQRGGDVS